jgi:heme-degrading monooxygenase HmoA
VFARLQTLHEPVEKLDALVALGREQLPTARELPGFRGFYYLVDRDNEKGLVISLWETEEDLRRLEANHDAVRDRVREEARIESPQSEIFEVALQAS